MHYLQASRYAVNQMDSKSKRLTYSCTLSEVMLSCAALLLGPPQRNAFLRTLRHAVLPLGVTVISYLHAVLPLNVAESFPICMQCCYSTWRSHFPICMQCCHSTWRSHFAFACSDATHGDRVILAYTQRCHSLLIYSTTTMVHSDSSFKSL